MGAGCLTPVPLSRGSNLAALCSHRESYGHFGNAIFDMPCGSRPSLKQGVPPKQWCEAGCSQRLIVSYPLLTTITSGGRDPAGLTDFLNVKLEINWTGPIGWAKPTAKIIWAVITPDPFLSDKEVSLDFMI